MSSLTKICSSVSQQTKMSSVSSLIGTTCFVLLISVVSPQPYLFPQLRNEAASFSILEPTSRMLVKEPLDYQIVPSDDYAVATVEQDLSLLDIVLSPITAVISLGSSALSVATWVFCKGSLILLGMGIFIAFCALTPYCTLTIEKPSFLARENVNSYPYLDQLESFFSEAYDKYLEMQRN